MTRSETKFQAPLNRCYQEVLAKTEHLTIKNYVNRPCEALITFSDILLSQKIVFENNEKIAVAIPAPLSGLTQWIRAFVTLFKTYKLFNQKMKRSVECVQNIK